MSNGRRRALIISLDPVGEEMAGLGIRCTELARVLSAYVDVVLATATDSPGEVDGVRTIAFESHAPRALRDHIAGADLVLAQPQWGTITSWLAKSPARVVFDLYDPETLETLELFSASRASVRSSMVALTVDRLLDAFRVGDHFVCASEKQRDLWIGAMLAARAITTTRYEQDPTFREVIDVVPFGVPSRPPDPKAGGIRAQFPQIGEQDEVVLWNGGIWGWLDAPSAVRAIAELSERRPGIRLVFMGAAANPAAEQSTREARAVASELALLDNSVFFNDSWVPYEERSTWLQDADCALSLHHDHLETRYAFRTRLLDCFWAALPVVCTAGDDLSALVDRDNLGESVPAGDHSAAATAIERVLDNGRDHYRAALERAANNYRWDHVAAPLVRWLTAPSVAARPKPAAAPRSGGHRARAAAYVVARHGLARRRRG